MKLGKRFKLLTIVLIVVLLTLGAPLLAYGGDKETLAEVRELLRNSYVEVVSEDVLSAPTINEMLRKLGDEHTQYLPKAEHDQFLNTLDRAFSGVGVELEIVPQGVLVTKAIEGYGAYKAGVRAGDIITEADGNSFAGKTAEYCVSKLRGAEGSKVRLEVKRGTEILGFTLERMVIELPLVESGILENHIGYIGIYSFGQDTVAQFDKHAQALKSKGVDSWIIDLRDNGGGYTQAALELLGFFIEDKRALILKDKSNLAPVHKATKQAYTLEGPIILLINGFTGSSSEIVTAALKDHNKATLIGETTFGSGRVKALVPLTNGDYFKMTVNKFFSPNNNPIDEVGITPHLALSEGDELQAAFLMLKEYNKDAAGNDEEGENGHIRLNAGPNVFTISPEELKKPENWKLGKEILDSAYVITTPELERYKLYYPEYTQAGNLSGVPLDKKFTVTFTREMDWQSVKPDSIELINTLTGERIGCSLAFEDEKVMIVTPQTKLRANIDYWLVIHSVLKDVEGRNITGGVALAKTVK